MSLHSFFNPIRNNKYMPKTLMSSTLLAQTSSDAPNGFAIDNDPGALADPHEAYTLLGPLISNLLALALFLGGLAALAFLIMGAIQWGTAGSGEGAAKGKSTMLYAAIGLIMLGLVYVVILIYNSLLA